MESYKPGDRIAVFVKEVTIYHSDSYNTDDVKTLDGQIFEVLWNGDSLEPAGLIVLELVDPTAGFYVTERGHNPGLAVLGTWKIVDEDT